MNANDGNPDNWQGVYGIQVYNATEVTLNDVSVTGAEGGILVNGSEVTLEGTVDVSGNESGGIEVSKGDGALDKPKLTVDATEKYGQESVEKPVIWIDGFKCDKNTDGFVKEEDVEDVVHFENGHELNGRKVCVHDVEENKKKHQYFYTEKVYGSNNNVQ